MSWRWWCWNWQWRGEGKICKEANQEEQNMRHDIPEFSNANTVLLHWYQSVAVSSLQFNCQSRLNYNFPPMSINLTNKHAEFYLKY